MTPDNQAVAVALSDAFLADFVPCIVHATREFLTEKKTLTPAEIEALSHQSRIADASKFLERLTPFIADPLELTPELKAELIEDIVSGGCVETEALFDASAIGRVEAFLAERQLPKYQQELKAIRAFRLTKPKKLQRLEERANSLLKAKQAGDDITKELAKLKAEGRAYFAKQSAKDSTAKYLSEVFGFTLSKAIRKYWLPYGLWRISAKEALRLLENSPAASVLDRVKAGSMETQEYDGLEAMGLDLATLPDRSSLQAILRSADLTSAFNQEAHRIRVAR
jgi:hypothetical protein